MRAIDVVRRLAPKARPEYLATFEAGDKLLKEYGLTTPLRQSHRGRHDPDINLVRDVFDYCPESGLLKWKNPRATRINPGTVAGSPSLGYVRVKIAGRSVMAHRIAWALHYGMWPRGDVDHINGIKSDNRIVNLRVASRSENTANAGARKNSTTGVRGVHRLKDCSRYRAVIRRGGKRYDLGLFRNIDEASAAYRAASARLFGDFGR